MAKRGRPKLPANQTREVFSLRLTQEELSGMARAAKRAKAKLREWAKNCLLKAAERDIP